MRWECHEYGPSGIPPGYFSRESVVFWNRSLGTAWPLTVATYRLRRGVKRSVNTGPSHSFADSVVAPFARKVIESRSIRK